MVSRVRFCRQPYPGSGGKKGTVMTNDAFQSIGGKSIKEEHDALIEQINVIDRLLHVNSRDAERIILSVRNLLETSRIHFQNEELIMAETNYGALLMHKRDHDYLRTSLIIFLESIEHNAGAAVDDIGINLRSWLEFHINKFDNAYVEFLTRQEQ